MYTRGRGDDRIKRNINLELITTPQVGSSFRTHMSRSKVETNDSGLKRFPIHKNDCLVGLQSYVLISFCREVLFDICTEIHPVKFR